MTKRRPMTETEWLASASPYSMLKYLHQHRRVGRVPGGQRRLRLFRCACCRSAWDLFDDERCRQAVTVAERYADGEARRAELASARGGTDKARRAAEQQYREVARQHPAGSPAWRDAYLYHSVTRAAHYAAVTQFDEQVGHIVAMSVQSARTAQVAEEPPSTQAAAARREQEVKQARLVRDIFGNPFRPSPPLPPAVLAWNGRLVPRLAQSIYDDRRPDGTFDTPRLGLLADALLDAGVAGDAEELLSHLRSDGPHWRGCWGVDLLLGRS